LRFATRAFLCQHFQCSLPKARKINKAYRQGSKYAELDNLQEISLISRER